MDRAQLDQHRRDSRAMWADGHYPTVAQHLLQAVEQLVESAGIAAGDRVLDVGTGSGAVAVAAARRGAQVVGIDQIDTWFDVARAVVRDDSLQVELLIADAEDLPMADDAFDVVVSNFAHIFAPRHDVVAGEMARVCRPGGVVACTAWAHDDNPHRGAFDIVQRYLGSEDGQGEAGPGDDPSNADWGDPAYLRDRFASHDVDMTVERHVIEWRFPSLEAHEDLILTASGPYRRLREALEAKGVWDRAWAEIRELDRRSNKADDGTYAMDQEYLLAVGHRR